MFALVFQLRSGARTVPDSDYQQVAQKIAAEAKPGDVILLYPWWTERARLFMPANVPVVGYIGSDKDPQTELMDHPRIWVLAQPDQPRADLNSFHRTMEKDGGAEISAQRYGRLWLGLYANHLYRPTLFSANDVPAQVYLENGSQRADCAPSGQGHQCPGGVTVAPEWHELFYAPYRCLTMHPPGGPGRTVAEFDSIPSAPLLRLGAGIIWEHAWKHEAKYTPVHVVVEEAGAAQPLASLTINPGQEGLLTQDVPLPGNGPHHLRVWTQSDNPEERDVCVQLMAYGDAR